MKLINNLFILYVVTFFLSFIIHNLYKTTNIPILAYFAPINESIFEHNKLITTPVILIGLISAPFLKDYPNYLLGLAIGTILAVLFMDVFVYICINFLNLNNFFIHMLSFVIALLILVFTIYFICQLPPIQYSNIIGLILIFLIINTVAYLTYNPLDLYIFEEHFEGYNETA